MKQNIYIAALLAGMLALAGCGGGSSSGPAKTDGMKNAGNGATATKVMAPTTASPEKYDVEAGTPQTYPVAAGESITFGGTDKYECAAGADCKVTLENQAGTLVIMSTGMLKYVAPMVTQPAQQTPPGGDTGPLGDASIIAAINGGKILGLPLTNLGGTTANTFKDQDGKTTTLWLWSDSKDDGITRLSLNSPNNNKDDNYIFWGHWQETTDVDLPGADQKRGLVWGGNKPYGTKPATDIATATFNGVAAHQSSTDGGKTWNDGGGTQNTSNVVLTANFKAGFIHGRVDASNEDDDVGDIMLKTAMFPSGDIFSGSTEVKLADSPAAGVTKGSGTWNGQFFGPQTGPGTGDDVRKIEDKAPSHVAGEFLVTRKTSTIETTTTRGTFGAD